MKTIAFFLRNARKTLILSSSAGILSGICNAVLLAFINNALKTRHAGALVVAGFWGLVALLPATRYVSERLLVKLAQDVMFQLRTHLGRQILSAPLTQLEELGPAKLLAALTDDIPSITGVANTIPVLCVNCALVISCLIYMGTLSWMLLAIVLGFMLLGIATYQLPILKVQDRLERARKDTDRLQLGFRGLTHGTKELKIHAQRRSAFMRSVLEGAASSLREHNTAALNLYAAAASWGQALVFVVVGLILFVLPYARQMPTSMLMGYSLALLYLMTPLQSIMNALPQLTRANVALQALHNLGLELSTEESAPASERYGDLSDWKSLSFHAVTHTYRREGDPGGFVLGPLDLLFRAGETVFITGGNGSGKTTLVKLLIGLYPPESGSIQLDGQPIDTLSRERYREHFSVVFFDFYLFESLLGLDMPDLDTRANEYMKRLKLSHKVRIDQGNFSTTELSQGQRKRLALLTALLEDRPIYVFDEWAADQDVYFKEVFYTQILPVLKARGKTVFVISHDDRYYPIADRIIKLADGQITSDVYSGPLRAYPNIDPNVLGVLERVY